MRHGREVGDAVYGNTAMVWSFPGTRPSKAIASTMLRGRKRDLSRIARKESLEEYITGIPSLASKEASYVPRYLVVQGGNGLD